MIFIPFAQKSTPDSKALHVLKNIISIRLLTFPDLVCSEIQWRNNEDVSRLSFYLGEITFSLESFNGATEYTLTLGHLFY